MSKRTWILLGILLILAAAAGVMYFAPGGGSTPLEPRPPGGPLIEIEDMTGRTVSIPEDPQRILSLSTTVTDTILRLGEYNRLAGIGLESTYIPGSQLARVLGQGGSIVKRQVVALGIDMAFAWEDDEDSFGVLSDLKVPVVSVSRPRAANVPDIIHFVGKCLGQSEHAEMLSRPTVEFLKSQAAQPPPEKEISVYLEMGAPYATVGSGTYVDDLLTLAGARNVAADEEGRVRISPEKLREADPDVILFVKEFGDARAFTSRPELGELQAVNKQRIFPIPRYWLVPGPALPKAVESVRNVIHQRTRRESIEDIIRPEEL